MNIPVKFSNEIKIPLWTLAIMFCAMFLISTHPPVVSAQETTTSEAESIEDDDIIISEDIIYIEELDEEGKTSESESTDEMEKGGEPSDEMMPEGEPGDRFPPEVREMMEEEGISPTDLMRDPELREKFREKVEKRMEEKGRDDSQPGENRDGEQRRRPDERGRDGGLENYTSSIVKNNLFLQLGSGGEKRGPQYALTAVMSNASEEEEDKAIIEQQGGGRSFYVSEGDTFAGNMEVKEIEDAAVKLNQSGEEIRLTLGEGTSGDGGGRRSGGAPGGGGRREDGNRRESGGEERGRGGDDFDPSQIPPFARRMLEERGISIEELRNNPDLRNNLRREFEQRFGGGGGRRRREVIRMPGR